MRVQNRLPMSVYKFISDLSIDTSNLSTKYTPKKPPDLRSKYMQFLNRLKQEATTGRKYSVAQFGNESTDDKDEKDKDHAQEEHFFHAWVYVGTVLNKM